MGKTYSRETENSRYIVNVKTYRTQGSAKRDGDCEPCSPIYFTAPSDSEPHVDRMEEGEDIQSILCARLDS